MQKLVELMNSLVPKENLIEYCIQKKAGLLYATVNLTPELAAAWRELAHPKQRNLRATNLFKLKQDIQSGEWNPSNGENLKFDNAGVFIDGNHRADLVSISKNPIQCQVVFGCNNRAYQSIDKGATRTTGNTLYNMGCENAGAIAAMAVRIVGYEHYRNVFLKPSDVEIAAFVEENYDALQKALVNAGKAKPVIPVSAGGFLSFEYSKLSSRLTDIFFEEFKTPKLLRGNAPLVLYKTIVTAKNKGRHKQKITREWMLAVCIKAINAFMQKKDIRLIRWLSSESFPEITDSVIE